jgi:hypothetical protein
MDQNYSVVCLKLHVLDYVNTCILVCNLVDRIVVHNEKKNLVYMI